MSEERSLPDSLASLSKTDAEYAEELRGRLDIALTPLLTVMSEARAAGFQVRWSAIAPTPPDGRHRVIGLQIIRVKIF